ncbi:uncharacterized protein LOC115703884 [Cannabis sativa]|uniref:uncharacterized protein LOC115703884 n=1 Tax=Cannabis sativa TaxID=3483 RepID=UPI0029CA66DC|nr:uncharacterized protein LOC115703884 [Cannabis sativa]
MDQQYAAMSLGDDDDGFLMYDNDTVDTIDFDDRWCLVGRFLTDRTIDFEAMQHKMASLWRPVRGLFVKELEPNFFLFQFYHEMDIERVMEGSPWTFDRIPLIFERLKSGENPRNINPMELIFWVQIHGLKAGFRSERVLKDLGNYMGSYVKMDPNNFLSGWRDYLRVRVRIRIDKALKKGRKLQMKSGLECHTIFKYEDLSTFCFVCGLLGHSERFCEKAFDTPPHLLSKPYNLDMKAPPRRRTHSMGARWLRTEMAAKTYGESSATPAIDRSTTIIKAVSSEEIMVGGNQGVECGSDAIMGNQDMVEGEGINGNKKGKSIDIENGSEEDDSQIILEQKRRRVTLGINGQAVQEDLFMEEDMHAVLFDDHVANNSSGPSFQKNLSGAGSLAQARQGL